MAQLKKKFIQDNAVDQNKLRLDNDANLRARNAANDGDVSVLKVNTSNRIEFASVPQVTSDPSVSNDLVRKSYVDSVAEGLKPKTAVRAASTANVDIATGLENGDTLDGVTLATGDRVLLKDQSAAAENGIYVVVASGAASRSTDFDSLTPIDEVNGAYVPVQEGTSNAGKFFVQTGNVATLDTDPINFVFFNSVATLSAGNGIDITSNVISVDHDGEGLTFTTGQLSLELDGSTLSKSATGLKVADAGITETQLNSSVAGNGLTGGAGSALAVQANTTETSTTEASAIVVAAAGVSISVDDSTIEGSGQGVAGAESLRVKDLGISTAKLAATSVTAAKLGSDVAGSGLSGGNGSAIDVNADTTNNTTKINGSDQIEGLKHDTEEITLIAGDITNQFIDLAQTARSAASITLNVDGGLQQNQGTDYTVSLAGGAGGVTRITFAGDLATAGAAALEAGDILMISYEYL